jgi:hypothetical protein
MTKKAIRLSVAVICFALIALSTLSAQLPNGDANDGKVELVVLVRVLPGHFNAFLASLNADIIPIWEIEKKSGLIQGYQTLLNTTSSSTDWDFGFSLVYTNAAALDGFDGCYGRNSSGGFQGQYPDPGLERLRGFWTLRTLMLRRQGVGTPLKQLALEGCQ